MVGRNLAQALLARLVKALAEKAEELAVVFEKDAEHLGDGDDILAHEDFQLDALGKENDPLLVTTNRNLLQRLIRG